MKEDSSKFALRLLEKYGVSVAPGSAFGDYPQFIRISTGAEIGQIIEGIDRLKKALED